MKEHKDFYVVMIGKDGFQKEETRQFENDKPLRSIVLRHYEPLSMIPMSYFPLSEGQLRAKDKSYNHRYSLFALGKNIEVYEETR